MSSSATPTAFNAFLSERVLEDVKLSCSHAPDKHARTVCTCALPLSFGWRGPLRLVRYAVRLLGEEISSTQGANLRDTHLHIYSPLIVTPILRCESKCAPQWQRSFGCSNFGRSTGATVGTRAPLGHNGKPTITFPSKRKTQRRKRQDYTTRPMAPTRGRS